MKALLVLQLVSFFAGIIFILIAFRHRNHEVPFLSLKQPVIGAEKAKLKFKTAVGFHCAVIGGILLGIGGLLGTIYWFSI